MTADDIRAAMDAADDYVAPDYRVAEAGPCPVQFLGTRDGTLYVLAPSGELRELDPRQLTHRGLSMLFGARIDWLWARFPRQDDKGNRTGWSERQVVEFMAEQGARAGLFNSRRDVRGPGVWRADDRDPSAGLVVHAGDAVLVDGRWCRPGRYGRFTYPAFPAEPRPADEACTAAEVDRLRRQLGTWHWSDAELSPHLLLGWVGMSYLVGALSKRPSLFVSGDSRTGKSTLMALVHALLGDSLLHVADATEPAVRQLLQTAARPVAIDEFEAEELAARVESVIKLARLAYDRFGPSVARGGQDGHANLFPVNACFLFNAILRPPMRGADINRMAWLDLQPLQDRKAPADLEREVAALSTLGPRLRRRMIDSWPRFQPTLAVYAAELGRKGHDSRACDTYGALLACAHLLLEDAVPEPEQAEFYVDMIDPADLASRQDTEPDHYRCLRHLMTSAAPHFRAGQAPLLGDMIAKAMKMPGGIEADELMPFGLRVVEHGNRPHLAVSNGHRVLAEIFADTHWRAKSGASGAWRQSLGRLPGAISAPAPVRFGGAKTRAVLIPSDTLELLDDVQASQSVPDGVPDGVPGPDGE